MLEKRNFAEILQEKLGAPPMDPPQKKTILQGKASFLSAEPSFSGPVFSWQSKGKKYVVRKKARPQPKPLKEEPQAPVAPPEPSISIHLLNGTERASLAQIQSMGGLTQQESLTEMQLKKAYRTLVKKYHPDKQTGSPEAFLKLQEAYNTLLKGFLRAIATCGNESASE